MKKRRIVSIFVGILALVILFAGYLALRNKNVSETENEEESTTAVTNIAVEDISKISFHGAEENLSFVKEGDTWFYEEDKEFPAEQTEITALLSNVTNIQAVRVLEDIDNINEFGLDSPLNTIKVTAGGEDTLIHVGNANEALNSSYIYLNEDTKTVYMIDSTFPGNFSKKLYELAEKDTFPVITGSTITNFTLDKKGSISSVAVDSASETGWTFTDSNGNKKPAGSSEVVTKFNNFSTLTFEEFVDYKETKLNLYGLDTPSAVITVDYELKVPDEEKPEGTATEAESEDKVEARQMVMYIGSADEKGNYYVRVEGITGIYTMKPDALSEFLNVSFE